MGSHGAEGASGASAAATEGVDVKPVDGTRCKHRRDRVGGHRVIRQQLEMRERSGET